MTVDWNDFVLKVKPSGQRIKKFKCTCDGCGADRGYHAKSKTGRKCLTCVRYSEEYIEKHQKAILKVRSTEESKQKTRDQIAKQKSNGWVPDWTGKPITLEKRIKQSCGIRKIPYESFVCFAGEEPVNKMTNSMRKAIKKSIGQSISVATNDFLQNKLGYSAKQLKEHIESQFEPWMNWENHGNYSADRQTWQIDHVIPLKYKKEDGARIWSEEALSNIDSLEFKEAWALTNLQPLSALANIKKSNRRIGK